MNPQYSIDNDMDLEQVKPIKENVGFWSSFIAFIVLPILGGLANQLSMALSHKEKITWSKFLCRAGISLFIGATCWFLLPRNNPISFATVSLLGWLGADGITLLLDLLKMKRK
jgi:hypothetical protein